MNYYQCLWAYYSGSQIVEGSRVVHVLGGISQAIFTVKSEVSDTLGIDPSEVTILTAEKINIISDESPHKDAPQKPVLGALSEDARASYTPQNPADLVDALQEPIHRDVGRSKPAKTARTT